MREAHPTGLADNELTLAWAESAALSRRKAENSASRELIAKTIRSVTGSSLRVAYALRADGDAPVEAATLSEDELIDRLVHEFDAEELLPEPSPDPPPGALMPQPPNLNQMLQQAQEMLAAQQEAQEKLKEQKVEASTGGGMVKVVMTGDMHIETLAIDPDAVDPEDVDMLQDMVLAAVNEAIRQAQQLQESQLAGAGGDAGGFDPMSALESLGLGGAGGPGGGLGGLGGGPGGPAGLPGGAPNRAARRRKK